MNLEQKQLVDEMTEMVYNHQSKHINEGKVKLVFYVGRHQFSLLKALPMHSSPYEHMNSYFMGYDVIEVMPINYIRFA